MRLLLMVMFCLCYGVGLSAKKLPKNPMKWGEIPTEDLQMTSYEADPEAAAVVLGRFGTIKYFVEGGYVKYKFQVHKRIKILKASALDAYADFEITHSASNQYKLKKLKVQSFTPDGARQKVRSRNKFLEEQDEYTLNTKVAIPNVQVGSVIEYKYTITSMAAKEPPSWYFQEEIPVRFSLLNVTTPEMMQFLYYVNGQEYMTDNGDGSYTYQGISKCKVIDGRSFMMENLRAVEGEDHITTISDYWASVSFYLQSYEYYGETVVVLKDWEHFANQLRLFGGFGEITSMIEEDKKGNVIIRIGERNKALLAAAAPILEDSSLTEKARLTALYDFINQEIKWNDYYSAVSDDLDTVFDKKEGASADMNLLLLALLRAANIEAYPTMLSTRSHGKAIEISPLQKQFNYTMLMVIIDGEVLFVDTRNKLRPIGYPSPIALNKRAWVIKDSTNEWIDLPAPTGASIYLINANLQADGTLEGVMKNAYQGYDAITQRTLLQAQKYEETWKEKLTDKYPELKMDTCRFENVEDVEALLKTEFNWSLPEAAQVSGDLMYLSPSFFSAYSENFLKQNERIYPVDFPHPFKEQLVVNIQLPAGYIVDELPEPVNLALPNKGGAFQYLIKEKDGSLQVISKLSIKKVIFQPWEYGNLKKLFDLIVEKHGEQLVLKKAP